MGSELLDAANLLLPIFGFIDANDPRMCSTIEAVVRTLLKDGLVYRYRGADDGLPGGEAAFAVCTFRLVENLVALGRIDEATRVFEGMLARATPLGLYAEEIEPGSGAQRGNFPQALTHIGLLNAAAALADASP
ncbi:MAG: glycoside hydrolase family 15 protein [Woeseiaceae bacterium]